MSRDTDRDWRLIAEREPHYGVLTQPEFRKADFESAELDAFYATGEHEIGETRRTLEHGFGPFNPASAIDFGCGVGRLSLAMAAHCPRVIGVDVAPGMLAKARERAAAKGIGNVEFVPELPAESVDWINSVIVLQHIPPSRGYGIIRALLDRLNLGGFLSLQLTFFKDREAAHPVVPDEVAHYAWDGETVRVLASGEPDDLGAIKMYDYDLNRVFREVFAHGIPRTAVTHTNHSGCHGVFIFGHRTI